MSLALGTHKHPRDRVAAVAAGCVCLAALVWVAPAAAQSAEILTSRNAEAAVPRLSPPRLPAHRMAEPVLREAALGNWARAYALAARTGGPVLPKVIDWLRFTGRGEAATFEDIATFVDQNPDWPQMRTLRANAEANLDATVATPRGIDWLSRHGPASPEGAYWLADAYLSQGERGLAERVVRRAWTGMNFRARFERRFYKRFRGMLTAEDHAKRIDRLLWRGRFWEARRMLRRVRQDDHIVAVARMRLRRFAGGVDWAIRRIPAHRLDDPGFVYERLRWRRRKGRDDDAIALLQNLPKVLPRPKLWWRERSTLARRALRKGNISQAYRLAHSHRQTKGAGYADAEWLAGWIALRFLKDVKTAEVHFKRLWAKVRYPVSRARAAYWLARAAEADGRNQDAQLWYGRAAQHSTSFYGQLAMARLSAANRPRLPAAPRGEQSAVQAYLARDVVQAARLIAASPDRDHLKAFIRHLSKTAKSPIEFALATNLALTAGRPEVALRAAKLALRENVYLIEAGWPRDPLPDNRRGLEPALVLALMRQESAFDHQAVSWAGARGLMQLMPATAKRVAKRLNLPFSRRRLLNDPQYNLTLGTAYLEDVIDTFGGSYVLGLVSYNAGPGRARRWLRRHGDFRAGDIDAVDWIELIPFDETRDYVQRVIENLQVYRVLLGQGRVTDTALNNAGL